jgi:hypothetical protein
LEKCKKEAKNIGLIEQTVNSSPSYLDICRFLKRLEPYFNFFENIILIINKLITKEANIEILINNSKATDYYILFDSSSFKKKLFTLTTV